MRRRKLLYHSKIPQEFVSPRMTTWGATSRHRKKKIAATYCNLLTVVVESMVVTEFERFPVLHLKTEEKNYLVVKIR